MPQRDVQTLLAVEETDAAFVVGPVIRKHVGLPDFAHAVSKRPGNRHGNRVRAVRDRIGDAVPVSLDRITISAVAKGEPRTRLKDKRLSGPRQSARHRGGLVRGRLAGMALRADFLANVSSARSRLGRLPVYAVELLL